MISCFACAYSLSSKSSNAVRNIWRRMNSRIRAPNQQARKREVAGQVIKTTILLVLEMMSSAFSRHESTQQSTISGDHFVKKLTDGAVGFQNGGFVVRRAGEVGVGESNSAERRGAQDLSRRGLAVFTEKEAWLRIDVSVAPAIQDDASNVAPGVKAGLRKHLGQLLADFPFIVAVGSGQQFHAD